MAQDTLTEMQNRQNARAAKFLREHSVREEWRSDVAISALTGEAIKRSALLKANIDIIEDEPVLAPAKEQEYQTRIRILERVIEQLDQTRQSVVVNLDPVRINENVSDIIRRSE